MRSKKADRITKLPDEVLSDILSKMPTKYAVRTSILSKRWRYNWTLVTNIDMDVRPFHGLQNMCTLVDRVLDHLKTTEIKLFRLRFDNLWVEKSSVTRWINEAIRLKVSVLDIQSALLELPYSLFTCKTITKLTLETCKYWEGLDWSTPFNLPCVKTLDIAVSKNRSLNAFKLIHGCPVLESLSLKIDHRSDEEEYRFSIPTLKWLKLTLRKSDTLVKVVLNVPNLEDLGMNGSYWYSLFFVMEDFPSLVSVTISVSRLNQTNAWVAFLNGIRAKSLSLMPCPDLPNVPLPKVPNIKHLELKKGLSLEWMSIFQFLEICSDLEHLAIMEPKESFWIEPQSVPTCLLTHLKTVEFENCMGRKDEIQFLEYMLRNAEVLKTLTITFKSGHMEDEKRLCAKLLKCPRASWDCENYFVGELFDSESS